MGNPLMWITAPLWGPAYLLWATVMTIHDWLTGQQPTETERPPQGNPEPDDDLLVDFMGAVEINER